jgi:hypothetical protein
MLIATRDLPREDIRAGVSRIAPDHPLAKLYPGSFVSAKDGPPAGVRTRDLAEMAERQEHERRVISNRMAEIEREDRQRESREKYERPETRRERIFWEQSERLLAEQREAEERTPAIYDIDFLLSAEQEAALERIDRDWGWDRN